jgi:hypothetical protein
MKRGGAHKFLQPRSRLFLSFQLQAALRVDKYILNSPSFSFAVELLVGAMVVFLPLFRYWLSCSFAPVTVMRQACHVVSVIALVSVAL